MWLIFSLLFIEGFIGTMVASIFESTSQTNEIISFFILIINIMVCILVFYKISKKDKNIFLILIFALFARVGMMFFDLYGRGIFVLPNSGLDSEKFYHISRNFPNIDIMKEPYAYFIGFINNYFFDHRLISQYANVIISMGTIITVFNITNEFNFKYKVKVIILSIIAFIPNYIIMSSILLRESLNIFLLSTSLLCFIKWWKNNYIKYFIFSLILSVLSALLHSGAIANTVGYIITFVLLNNKERRIKLGLKESFSIAIFIVCTMLILSNPNNPIGAKFKGIDDVESLVTRTSYYEDGGSAYAAGTEVETVGQLLMNSPKRMFYFLASPLPWDWRGINDIIAFVFSGVFYIASILYGLMALKRKKYENRNFIVLCLILALLSSFLFAWGTSNAGAALRHRDKFIVNYLIMLGLALDSKRKLKSQIN